MKIKVQRLNESGIEIFQSWLLKPDGEPPIHILEDSLYCDEIQGEYFVETTKTFDTTFDLGLYLHTEVFAKLSDTASHNADNNMWAWTSLALVQSLLTKSKGKNRPLALPHYIQLAGQKGQRLNYRLITRTAWNLVRIHSDIAKVALTAKKTPWGEMAEQMSSRQEVFAHPCFWSLASRLYRNQNGEIRRGATSQRPASARKDPKNKSGKGGVRRLPQTFRQFDRTYSTRDMTLEEMLIVLPREYEKWANAE